VPGAGWIVPESLFQDAVDEAGRLAEFDPDRDTTVEAIRRTDARVLLVHGTGDLVVPHKHSVRLHEAAPEKSELISVPWVGHVVIWVDPMGDVATKTRQWFDRWLAKPDKPAPGI
ncbi:MAG: alpha/beta hydrolase, partial [Planctomycetota bacterium]|nr:alpha/beta hydrolase [Planctomycetota bacterium]